MTSSSPKIARLVALPLDEPPDVELVRRARDGHGWAHEAIYRRYVQRVAQVARRLLRDSAELEDVVQETFLIAFETIDRLADPAALRGWLTRIAIHRVHRRFRWSRWTRLWSAEELAFAADAEVARGVSPDQRAELLRIDRVLQRLPVKIRTPWVLRHVLGDSLDDVALACQCSLATAKRRIAEVERHLGAHVAGEVSS